MNRIEATMENVKKDGGKVLVAYLTGCLPDMDGSLEYFRAIESGGADMIEIGVPFSDALADGPVNQAAALKSIKRGTSVDDIFMMVRKARETSCIPIILLVYFNTVLHYGIEGFTRECAVSGADGLVIPDLPFEERGEILPYAEKYGLCVIPLVAPTSGNRVNKITENMRGFTYCVSSMGVTGERKQFHKETDTYIRHVNEESSLPVVVGFGISDRESAELFYSKADGIIVGTSIVRRILAGMSPDDIRTFVSVLK